jgi:hypothetical protein
MEHRFASTLLGFFAFLTLLASIKPAGAADWTQSYCSSLNTGSDDQVYTWPWQSNGNCTNHCKEEGTYAFAVLQYTDCWCSNYAPGDTANMDDCEVDCPGFPTEKCGNKDKDLFMYIEMDGQVSGTVGGSQPTSSAAAPSETQTEPPKTSAPPPPPVVTVRPDPEIITSVVTATPSSSTSSSTTSAKPSTTQSSEADDAPTSAQRPVTMPTVVTESGRIVTRTLVVTPSATAAPAAETAGSEKKTNVGAIAGGVAGGVIALLAIAGGILFVLWRKRRQQDQQQNGHESGPAGISRNVSTMSRAGLLGGRSEKSPTQLVTNFGSQRSRHDDESITPVTPSARRLSQPILVDSRLNPTAVLTFHGANASRESLGSIDDSRDYGRQLNVRNPDPN